MAKKKIEETVVEAIEINKVATVTAAKLNVRADANTNSSVIKIVSEGDKFEVRQELTNGFYELVEGGFVMADYVTVE